MNLHMEAFTENKNTILINFNSSAELLQKVLPNAVALANGTGGNIICGVAKEGRIIGCPYISCDRVMDHIHKNTVPAVLCTVENLPLEKNILFIEVYPRRKYVSTRSGKVYLRVGSETVSRFDEISLMMEHTGNDFSAQVCGEINDINPELPIAQKARLRALRENSLLPALGNLAFMRAIGCIRDYEDKIRPTVTGILIFGKNSAIKRLLPNIGIEYLFYYKHKFKESKIMSGENIIAMINKIIKTIMEDSPKIWMCTKGREILFETIFNAFVHQDYTKETPIKIINYDGNLEIISCGRRLLDIGEENVLFHAPRQRNAILCYAMKKLRYSSFSGNGVKKVTEFMLKEGYSMPEYLPMKTKVRLIIKLRKRNEKLGDYISKIIKKTGKELSVYELIALKYYFENKDFSFEEIMKLTELKTAATQKLIESTKKLVKQK